MKVDIDKDIGMHLPTPGKKSRCFTLLILLILVFGLTGFGLYNKNYLVLTPNTPEIPRQTNQQEQQLQQENIELQKLQAEFNSLKKELIALSRENTVQQATNKELNRKLLKVEDELTEAKNKQLLYEDILSPDDLQKGLHIRHFGLRKKETSEGQRRHHYLLVLSQVRGGKKIIKGQYSIRFSGKQDGKNKNYSHRELAADGVEAERKFSLKYYQSLEGDIILPEGFEPEKVTLWIMPKSKNFSTQRKSYQWKPLIDQNN